MEHDVHVETLRGLPGPLPAGERILWQGAPAWKALAIEVFHIRAVAIYGALLIAWRTITVLYDGGTLAEAAIVTAWLLLLPVGAISILCVLAWATTQSTVYTVTDRRVVMRIGIALTLTLNLPFNKIASAAFKPGPFGTGDIALTTSGEARIGYLVLWPHARPWVMRRPQPALRCVPEGETVANLLSSALAKAAHQPPKRPVTAPQRESTGAAPRPALAS